MAQAAIDLPDPLNNSGPVGPGVDDLLAQLAGEEIDRLLAEADVERPASPAVMLVPHTATSPATEPIPADTHSSTGALAPSAADPAQLQTQPEPSSSPTPIAEADVEELDARVAQELNSLFTDLDSDNPSSAARQPAAPGRLISLRLSPPF